MANIVSTFLLCASLLLVSSLLALACSFFVLKPLSLQFIFPLNAASADCQVLLCLLFAARQRLAAGREHKPHAETGSPLGPLLVNTSVVIDRDASLAEER